MAAAQWPQQYQQYQQQPQQYQQQQQYGQGQQYQQPQQYQQNQQYQVQQYQQAQQTQPTQQYQLPPKSQPTQQYQQQPHGYPVQQYQQNQQYQAHHYQQPQQGQPTQQYQQAQQGQPAQQYPQSHPSQPAQQYPQQQSQQPQQGHNGYQHQYVPQQYPSQQYAPQQQGSPQHGSPPVHTSPQQPVAPQQYGTSQYGAHQQLSQPQRNPAHGQSPAQVAHQSCFNCGNTGHFAMDCPEPIRAVPAGKINPQAFQNPLRRPKTATHHQYTPHPGHTQASPNGYPTPHGQTGYQQNSQYQQAYSPATPNSAHSHSQAQYYQQWQQYYQSQQAHQQGNHGYQGSSYHQQPYTAPQIQTSGYPNGSQTPSQANGQASQHTGGTQMYQSRFTPASTNPIQFNHSSSGNKSAAQPDQRNQFSTSTKPQSSPASPHNAQVLDYDFEEDDLDSLDIPDIPQTTLHFANASQQPVNLISQPLPGNSVVVDALAPFPPPAPQDEGCCRSKYQYDAGLEASLEHFKYSKYWDKEHADDVAFSDIQADGKIVPVDEILLAIKQRRAHPEPSDEFNRDSRTRSQSRTVSMNQDSLEVKITLDRMERELAETKAKLQAKLDKGRAANPVHASPVQSVKLEQPTLRDHEIKKECRTPPPSASFEKSIKSEQDTEDVLAALGVSGTPKPVSANTWPDQYTGHGSPNDMHMSRSRSSSRADTFGGDQKYNPSQTAGEHQTNGSVSYNQHVGPPPPPPPPMPFRQQSYQEGPAGSPLSTGITQGKAPDYNANGVDHGNGNGNGFFSPPTDGQAPSPIESRSDKSHSRKRHRDSTSDEEDTPKRRQEDDYTPKLKKRQPKVAEAYSRRW